MAYTRPHASNLRKGRYSQPGLYYFLTASVAGRRQVFTNRNHAMIVLEAIRWLRTADRFNVDAAVVMPDHLHLVGQLGESTLAKVMHTLKSYSAQRLAAVGVESPVWQKGYHDHGLRDDEDYRVRVQYVLQNPLRAGLVRRVEDYPYVILPDWWNDS
jgi:REP element-mobilizing transposase RayT